MVHRSIAAVGLIAVLTVVLATAAPATASAPFDGSDHVGAGTCITETVMGPIPCTDLAWNLGGSTVSTSRKPADTADTQPDEITTAGHGIAAETPDTGVGAQKAPTRDRTQCLC